MPFGTRKFSCWTCRMRKKRCDKTQPACMTCLSLGITCHFDSDRPGWLDNGRKQDAMMKQIKAEVKQGAEARKRREYIQVVHLECAEKSTDDAPSTQELKNVALAYYGDDRSDISGSQLLDASRHSRNPDPHQACGGYFPNGTPPFVHEPLETGLDSSLDGLAMEDMDTGFTMTYIDYAFPFLFPFYRPPIREAGRTWLLAMLKSNKVICYSAMSLGSYLSTFILAQATFQPNEKCRQDIWAKLKGYLDSAIRIMQQDIQEIKQNPASITVFHKCQTLGSIVQLLVSEIAITRSAVWNVHLVAANALLNDIFEHHGTEDGHPDMVSIMNALNRESWKNYVLDGRVWNTDQAAFRFYVAILLYADIIASTLLAASPRLQEYHDYLLAPGKPVFSPQEQLHLEDFVGCQGWVLVLVGEIATLDARKAGLTAAGKLFHLELAVSRKSIARKLQHGIADIHAASSYTSEISALSSLHSYSQIGGRHQENERLSSTLIWAYAAEIYLALVTSGWDPMHPKICVNVKLVLELFLKISSPAHIRNLAWPLCVAGCLATIDQESQFLDIFERLGSLRSLGSIEEVYGILKRLWAIRGQFDKQSWSLSECFRTLATGTLWI